MSLFLPPPQERRWRDPVSGFDFRVRIAPRERAGTLGVDPRLNAVVFEAADGEWVGSVPVSHTTTLWSLGEQDLAELLEQAMGLG